MNRRKVIMPVRQCAVLLLAILPHVLSAPNLGVDGPSNEPDVSHLDADDPDFSGVVDFSNAVPGPGGSWCITKMKYVEHMVKDQVKECWHENVTQCHDTFMTEFLPSQEQKCEETFWKSCKIDFAESPYNYTMKHCHTPLLKECDDPKPSYNPGGPEPKIVCQTWFESECNTTVVNAGPNAQDKANTWCKKVPKKICAPDNCKMVPGEEECHEKLMVSTIEKPSEICDLQPQRHCRLITRLVPHLMQKEVCRDVPKEVCHLGLANPHKVKRPMQLKWCTKKGEGDDSTPTYQTSYLPPPGATPTARPFSATATPTYKPPNKFVSQSPALASFDPPTFNQPGRAPIQLQLREDNPVDLPPVFETKFKPQIRRNFDEKKIQDDTAETTYGGDSTEILEDGPIFRQTASIQIPSIPVSISDDISGEDVNGVFAEVNF